MIKQPWGAVQINKALCAIISGVGIGIISWGCNANNPQIQDTRWNIYRNKRYGFEFPYPHTWQVLRSPDNSDGVVLVSPNQKNVEIRAYASKPLLKSLTKNPQPVSNFQTHQGFSGVMAVEVGEKVTVMKLTITQEQLEYHWQGKSDRQDFQNYYRLFYYIAQEYKISQ
ncbi:hypothetical protein MEO40_05060 [Dolichospermum sp. ST_sed1]|nr:hypothetical protein [Dolichospermum sp. ST_sed1]MDD1423900.1 hypothetical protein [Dolichospermum sp. ST_sed9]MDD1431571.1 hypothetical protein [Dolichospermum sp. ST_sed6]MDD1440840.1 hypothetical protein [Dolichospermum sp. ST_sed3]MDD1447028.1 hypothetical protein [Dolichospermum sp. ST_sed8]MDD1454186.1 hypothetical protein [Dolichospermum sp. ST_sed7]MDD1458774.1 hypothetical protein [Dolichospermum sp. ST_sed2]MDD1468153.1 hypothetical protein [Dolichospermum sp. ST_sed5]MDD147098